MSGERHPTQQELLAGAIHTLEEVLIPELHSDWARSSAMGLLGQLRFALSQAASDSLATQSGALDERMNALCIEFSELRAIAAQVDESDDPAWDLRERAGRMLVFAQEDDSAAAVAVRERLRPLLVSQVEQDLAETHSMLQAFLASGSLGSTG